MIHIKIVAVGNLKEDFWQAAENEYKKRLKKFCDLQIVEIAEQNILSDVEKIKNREGEDILAHIAGTPILLDIHGKEFSSEDIANKIADISQISSTITFVIGGSYGVSDLVRSQISQKLSSGQITLPHNPARVVLLEQIYRAFMINSGSKYHK